MNTLQYTSFAKINLGLQVLNKRADGYHNIHSLFVEIDLDDILEFRPASTFQLSAEGADVPTDDINLIAKASTASLSLASCVVPTTGRI